MSTDRVVDELLRLRGLEMLGPIGDELARAALGTGAVAVEHDVLAWEGSHGTIRAHRVVVMTPAELHARVVASHATMDSLSAALSAAMAERAGQAVADIRLEIGIPGGPVAGPYRGSRA